MTMFLIRLFVKNYDDIKNASVRSSYGALAGAVGIVTNLLISVLKFIIGSLSASISVTADAINNLSDAGSSIITLVGFRLSGLPADKEHPYGHARLEYVTGLIVSMLVTFLGGILLIESVGKIISPEQTAFEWAMIIALGISVAVKLWQCFFYNKLGSFISSESLKASSADSRNDCISTLAVLTGMIVSKAFPALSLNGRLDGILGVCVAIFIIVSGIKLVIETVNPLLGTAPDPETINALKKKILSGKDVLGLHDMIIHSYGANHMFCSVHVEVPSDGNIVDIHDNIDNIEEEVYGEFGIFLVIHMDPVAVGDERITAMKKTLSDIISKSDDVAAFHDFRAVFGPTHDNIIFDIVVPFSVKTSDTEIKRRIITEFSAVYPKSVMKISIDRETI